MRNTMKADNVKAGLNFTMKNGLTGRILEIEQDGKYKNVFYTLDGYPYVECCSMKAFLTRVKEVEKIVPGRSSDS